MNEEKTPRLKTLYLYESDVISVFQKDGRVLVEEGLLPEDYRVERAYFDPARGERGAFGFIISSSTFPEIKDFLYPEEIPYDRIQELDDSTGRRRHVTILRCKETKAKFL